jgi:hypothetical protein
MRMSPQIRFVWWAGSCEWNFLKLSRFVVLCCAVVVVVPVCLRVCGVCVFVWCVCVCACACRCRFCAVACVFLAAARSPLLPPPIPSRLAGSEDENGLPGGGVVGAVVAVAVVVMLCTCVVQN